MAKSNADYAEFNQNDVEILQQKRPYDGYFQLDEYTLRHRKHEGGWSQNMTREILERGHASAMLLFDPEKDVVVLIEQFRAGALAAGYNPWLLEVPAGIIDEGQTPEEVAIRETEEETGCKARKVELIADYLVTPGCCSETIHLYYVEVDAGEANEFAGLEHEGEHIRVLQVPTTEAFEMLNSGQIHNSTGIIALQWLKLHHNKLRKK